MIPAGTVVPSRFQVRQAFFALFLFIGIKVLCLFFVVPVLVSLRKKASLPIPIVPIALVLSDVTSGAAIAWLTWSWAQDLIRDQSPGGLGLVRPSGRSVLLCFLVGAAIGAGEVLLISQVRGLHREPPDRSIAWVGSLVVNLLLAPATEELLFRGLFLRGLAVRWGIRSAAIWSVVTYVLVDQAAALFDWPLLLADVVLALAALAARLRSGSLYGAMAIHFVYRAIVTAAFLL
jgi:membrane protease YdiL (CAAX protease family)